MCSKIFYLIFIFHFYCYYGLTDAVDIFAFIDKIFRAAGTTLAYTATLGNNYFPLNQEVTFWCFKPGGQTYSQVFINDPNVQTKLDPTKPVNFVVHGFFQSFRGGMLANYQGDASESWVHEMASDWSKYANCNTCAVDWSKMAATDYSIAAEKNTRLVANQMVLFVNSLLPYGVLVELINVAGHSLGAHIAGFFGSAFQGRINTIFGLDAAGPGFTVPLVVSPSNRLDPTDAKFVQCVHTSGLLGTKERCGHADHRANGGESQPGCGINPLCDHSRASALFRFALKPTNKFIGKMCAEIPSGGLISNLLSKLTAYIQSKTCVLVTQDLFGIYTSRYSGVYDFVTTDDVPFAIQGQ